MSCLGVLFSLDPAQAAALRATPEDGRVEHVQEVLEEELWRAEPDRGQELDKAWDAMHRALTDGDLGYANGEYPLSHAVLGGEPLYSGDDYVISLKTPAQVRDVAAALAAVTPERLRAGYDAIDPAAYGTELSDEDFAYTWDWFGGVVEFYRRAAAAGRAVIFTADQ